MGLKPYQFQGQKSHGSNQQITERFPKRWHPKRNAIGEYMRMRAIVITSPLYARWSKIHSGTQTKI